MIWFVLTVAPQRERIVARDLKAGLGLRSTVPYERLELRRNNRVLTRIRPLIPGYVFAGSSYAMPWRDIRETRHVHGWLTVDDDIPAAVSDQEIAEIQRLAEQHNQQLRQIRTLGAGDKVRVKDGPFANIETLIRSVRGSTGSIEVPILGSTREIKVSLDQLEAVA